MKYLKNLFKLVHLMFYGLALLFVFGCEPEVVSPLDPALSAKDQRLDMQFFSGAKVLRVPEQYETIQQAVEAAGVGDKIRVAAGSYHESVHIIGEEKNGLQIIAVGSPGSVELVGDHNAMTTADRAAFYLQDVSGVVVKGFKTRDFGMGPLSAMGEGFLLINAHNNRIEHNEMTASDMMGVTLFNSSNNTIAHNTIYLNDIDVEGRVGTGCGVHIEGGQAAGNIIHRNNIQGNPLAGIMLRRAGWGNTISENIIHDGGLWGVTNRFTDGTQIENNQIYGHQGFTVKKNVSWVSEDMYDKGVGIDIASSSYVRVVGNRLSDNKTADIESDGLYSNTNIFERNR